MTPETGIEKEAALPGSTLDRGSGEARGPASRSPTETARGEELRPPACRQPSMRHVWG